jgi:hypothetical protein
MKTLYVAAVTDHTTNDSNLISSDTYINFYYTDTKEEAIGLFVKRLPPVNPNTKRWDITCESVTIPKQLTKWWEGFLAGILAALAGIITKHLLHI